MIALACFRDGALAAVIAFLVGAVLPAPAMQEMPLSDPVRNSQAFSLPDWTPVPDTGIRSVYGAQGASE